MLKAVLMASTLGMAALTLSAPEASAAIAPQFAKATNTVLTPVGWGHHHGFHRFGGFHHRHFGHRGFFIGAPVYGYGYGYGDGCGWLRHRAVVTGSAYWWRRYRWCRGW